MPFPYLIISDSNYRQFTGRAPAGHFSTGYKGWQRPDKPHAFRGKRPVGQTVPRGQWHDLIQAGQGAFLSDLIKNRGIQAKDQNGLSMCWVYGSTRAVEVQRAIACLPFHDLSPESVGGPCTNWRDEGGYASEAFDQLQNFGACDSSFMDAPHSLRPNRWKAGWQENAKLHEAVDWYEIDGDDSNIFDEVITCLLHRVPVAAGLDWWGHLVCFLDPVILPDGSVGVLFQNSWGVDWPSPGANGLACLTEDRATPDGAAAPIVVTESDE
jgi:hypothetical protein